MISHSLLLVHHDRAEAQRLQGMIAVGIPQLRTTVAFDALMALQICGMQPIEAVLVDEYLPHFNGEELRQMLATYFPTVYVVLAVTSMQNYNCVQHAAIIPTICKPIQYAELWHALAPLLGQA